MHRLFSPSVAAVYDRRFRPLFLAAAVGLVLALVSPWPARATQQVELKTATGAVVITPGDSTTIPATRGIYVGVSGDIKVNMSSVGTAIVFKAVPVGLLNISATRIYSTGTTATNLVAVY
jgi:hypothetical protein